MALRLNSALTRKGPASYFSISHSYYRWTVTGFSARFESSTCFVDAPSISVSWCAVFNRHKYLSLLQWTTYRVSTLIARAVYNRYPCSLHELTVCHSQRKVVSLLTINCFLSTTEQNIASGLCDSGISSCSSCNTTVVFSPKTWWLRGNQSTNILSVFTKLSQYSDKISLTPFRLSRYFLRVCDIHNILASIYPYFTGHHYCNDPILTPQRTRDIELLLSHSEVL